MLLQMPDLSALPRIFGSAKHAVETAVRDASALNEHLQGGRSAIGWAEAGA